MIRSSKRTERVRFKNSETGLTKWKYVETVTYRYEEEKKVPIVLEFLEGESSADALVTRWRNQISAYLTLPIDLFLM